MGGQQSKQPTVDELLEQDIEWEEEREVQYQGIPIHIHVQLKNTTFAKSTLSGVFKEVGMSHEDEAKAADRLRAWMNEDDDDEGDFEPDSNAFASQDEITLKSALFTIGTENQPCATFVMTRRFVLMPDLVIKAYTNKSEHLDCPDDIQHGYDRFIIDLVEQEAVLMRVPLILMQAQPIRITFTRKYYRLSPMYLIKHGLDVYQRHGYFHCDVPRSSANLRSMIHQVNAHLAQRHIDFTCPKKYKEYMGRFKRFVNSSDARLHGSSLFSKMRKLKIREDVRESGHRWLIATLFEEVHDKETANDLANIDEADKFFFFNEGEDMPLIMNNNSSKRWSELDPAKVQYPLRVFKNTDQVRGTKDVVEAAYDPQRIIVTVDNNADEQLDVIHSLLNLNKSRDLAIARADMRKEAFVQREILRFLEDQQVVNLRQAQRVLFAQYWDTDEVTRRVVDSFLCMVTDCELPRATLVKVVMDPTTKRVIKMKQVSRESEHGIYPQFQLE